MDNLNTILGQVVEQSLIEIYLVELQHLSFVYVNDAGLQNTGYSSDEILALTLSDISARLSSHQILALISQVLSEDDSNAIVSYRNSIRRKNGTIYQAQGYLQKILYDGNPTILFFLKDVTDSEILKDQHKLLLDSAAFGTWDLNVFTDEYRVNEQSLAILGRTREEIGTHLEGWMRFVHPEDRAAVDEESRLLAKEDAPWTVECRMKHKDGRWVWIRTTIKVIERDSKTGEPLHMVGTHIDITSRKTDEEHHERIFRFFEISQDLMIVANMSGEFLQVNHAAEKLLGYTPEEMLQRPIISYIHPDDHTATYADLDKLLREGVSFEHENRMRCKDGRYKWFAWRSTLDASSGIVYGLARDITVEKQIREELGKQQERYRALVDNTADVILQYDRLQRHIYVNPMAEIIFKRKASEMLGKTRFELGFPNELCGMWETLLERVFTTGEATAKVYDFPRSEGNRTIDWRAFPVFDLNGQVESVFSVSRDITDMRQAEEENQRNQKLSSLGILAGGIAHDFNNILMVLFGNIALAKSRLAEGHRSIKDLEKAESAFDRATHLTTQLLTFAKGGDPIRNDVSICELIEEVTHFDLSGSNVKALFERPKDLWLAKVDRGQIAQVFSNLIINANQAMPKGGHIYISAENITVADDVIAGLTAGNYIGFTVQDEGSGISPENLQSIFDPYFTTKDTGSGLGLATVHSIVQKHGGAVFVTSTLGKGTTFRIYLPASEQTNATILTASSSVPQEAGENQRILVMDDEADIRNLLTGMLERQGYEVSTAPNGEETLNLYQQAKEQGEAYACVITDLTIPGGMGGAETVGHLLALDPAAKVIVTSGYAADPVLANYERYGFCGCLTKPFTLERLAQCVSTVLEQVP